MTTDPKPGTVDERPRWEGPPENRPRSYKPSKNDPETDRDAVGENLPILRMRGRADWNIVGAMPGGGGSGSAHQPPSRTDT